MKLTGYKPFAATVDDLKQIARSKEELSNFFKIKKNVQERKKMDFILKNVKEFP
jgi:hypothetical protein